MPTLGIFDLIVMTFASYFIMNYIYRKETVIRAESCSHRSCFLKSRTNPYFLLAMIVCVLALGTIYFIVPYGQFGVFALAVCGLCSVIMDLMLLAVTCWTNKIGEKDYSECKRKDAEVKGEKEFRDPYKPFY